MRLAAIFILLSTILVIESAAAHGGRTNSSGCHNERKTGGYHCHNGGNSSYRHKYNRSQQQRSENVQPVIKPTQKIQAASIQNISSMKYSQYKALVIKIQKRLKGLGYQIGRVDGVLNAQTSDAIKAYQIKNGLEVTGMPSTSLL